MTDEKLKCGFCGKVLAKSSNQEKKDIEIRCPKCKKINKF
jgi:phage FluMu protein Com